MDVKIERTIACDDEMFNELTQTVKRVNLLEELFEEWVIKGKHSIRIGTGINSKGKHSLVAVELREGVSVLAGFYIARDYVFENYPNVVPVDHFLHFDELNPNELVASSELDRREEEAGITFDKSLVAGIMPINRVIPFCLDYAVSNIGEAVFSPLSDLSREDLESQIDDFETKYQNKELYTLDIGYEHHQYRQGWGSCIYVVVDAPSQTKTFVGGIEGAKEIAANTQERCD